MADHEVDVFISGAGPAGLVLAYQLKRLGRSVFIIDAADKASPAFPMYGRACTLHSRTLEMLDQLDLYEDMAQIGVVGKRTFTYRDGKPVDGRGWGLFERLGPFTFFDFSLNIRLKYSEDIFRAKLANMGVKVYAPVKLVDFQLDERTTDEHKVTAHCRDSDGKHIKVRAKYIVGSDGGSSTVRQLAGIPFDGERHANHWVRIDGMVKSNISNVRKYGFGTFESKTHGHVLWVNLDHGATRIGYALSSELYDKYGTNMSAEDVIKEAKQACAPFEIEFEEVHWHTVYGIKQFIADRFLDRGRILLAGDAAHTHSSGFAQGMNTGMHDVVNLGWRLAGVLNGLYKHEILATYSDERRASAQILIDNDKLISVLISGKKPEKFKDSPKDPMILLDELMRSTAMFSVGLGISYDANIVNAVEESSPKINVIPGHRFPDVLLCKNGLPEAPVRLYEVAKNNGKFHVLVFTGDKPETTAAMQSLRADVDDEGSRFEHVIDFVTIIPGTDAAFDEYLGVTHLGKAYWDIKQEAHAKFKIPNQGALVVLRPDGLLGFVAPLDGFARVAQYLDRLVIRRPKKSVATNGHATRKELGDFITPDENNLAMPIEGQSKEEGMAKL